MLLVVHVQHLIFLAMLFVAPVLLFFEGVRKQEGVLVVLVPWSNHSSILLMQFLNDNWGVNAIDFLL